MASRPPPSDPSPEAQAELAGALARRLMAGVLAPNADDAAMLAGVERIGTQLVGGLARWFGPYGASAVVTRALARVRGSHAALASIAVGESPPAGLTGLRESARTHGARAVVDGIVATLETLTLLIGGLVGDDLALSLLEQSMTPRPASDDASPLARDPAELSPAGDPQQTVKAP